MELAPTAEQQLSIPEDLAVVCGGARGRLLLWDRGHVHVLCEGEES